MILIKLVAPRLRKVKVLQGKEIHQKITLLKCILGFGLNIKNTLIIRCHLNIN